MLGERNWKDIINKVINEKYDEYIEKIDDNDRISIDECIRCLRRSYYERREPIKMSKKMKMHKILTNAVKSRKRKEYEISDITIIGYADVIMDGMLFSILPRNDLPREPLPEDLLALNANLCIFDIDNGVLLYVDGGGNSIEFSVVKDNRLFNETIRRAKILSTLLKEKKVPIIEPSNECIECQYQERCYIRKWKYGDSLVDKIFGKIRED